MFKIGSKQYLQIKFAKSVEGCLTAARWFQSIASNEAIDTCVCAIDSFVESVPSKHNFSIEHVLKNYYRELTTAASTLLKISFIPWFQY